MGIVKKEIPVTEKITTKKSLYKISDFSFLFWFRFIYPYREEIERENIKYVLNILKKTLIPILALSLSELLRNS